MDRLAYLETIWSHVVWLVQRGRAIAGFILEQEQILRSVGPDGPTAEQQKALEDAINADRAKLHSDDV